MEWTPGGSDEDIEDRRDESGGGGGGGFGPASLGGIGGSHIGIGGALLLGILSLVFHQNFFSMLSGGGGAAPGPAPREAARANRDPGEKREYEFVKFVLNDVQRTWDTTLPESANRPYRHAKLVLYRDEYPSACGQAQSAIGPFYCPGDEKVYLDLSFFDELASRFGAPGEFAQAYVIAHEIGHHVQRILGIETQVRRLQQRDPSEKNHLSVSMELQADCLAGIWAHSTQQRKIVNEADITQGLAAAASVGDDRLQRMAGRRVNPESFTHGSSAQRTRWFKEGFQSGRVKACNTFSEQQ